MNIDNNETLIAMCVCVYIYGKAPIIHGEREEGLDTEEA